MLHVRKLIVGQLQTNCYLVSDNISGDTYIIDPGDDATYITDTISTEKLHPIGVLATHGHFDHVLSAFELQHIYDIPFYVHRNDEFLLNAMQKSAEHYLRIPIVELPATPSKDWQNREYFKIGRSRLDIIESPGHTPGGICLYEKTDRICFTGDTVFAGGAIGDWRHTYSDKQLLLASVMRILTLPGSTILYPGHGPETTVQEENMYKQSGL